MKGEAANETMAVERMHVSTFKAVDAWTVEEVCPTKSVGKLAVNKFEFILVDFVGVTERLFAMSVIMAIKFDVVFATL